MVCTVKDFLPIFLVGGGGEEGVGLTGDISWTPGV